MVVVQNIFVGIFFQERCVGEAKNRASRVENSGSEIEEGRKCGLEGVGSEVSACGVQRGCLFSVVLWVRRKIMRETTSVFLSRQQFTMHEARTQRELHDDTNVRADATPACCLQAGEVQQSRR